MHNLCHDKCGWDQVIRPGTQSQILDCENGKLYVPSGDIRSQIDRFAWYHELLVLALGTPD